jgi:hypothetical protein
MKVALLLFVRIILNGVPLPDAFPLPFERLLAGGLAEGIHYRRPVAL